LVGLARTKLHGSPRRVADEEDVALSAFDSFCRNAAQGRFPQLFDRDGLWKLLVLLTARKAAHQRRDELRRINLMPQPFCIHRTADRRANPTQVSTRPPASSSV